MHEVRHVCGIVFDNPLVAKLVLRVGEVLQGVLDVGVVLRSEIIGGVLGDVVPFGSGLFGSHNDLVVVHSFGNADGILGTNHIGIRAERWNEVVEVITKRSLLMSVLGASSGGADGVGSELHLSLNGSGFGSGGASSGSFVERNVGWFIFNNPLVTKFVLSVGEVALRMDDVLIKFGVEVVHGILGNIVILGSSKTGGKIELVRVHSLSNGDRVGSSNHIGVSSVIGNGIIEWISERSLLVSVLGATSRTANRIRLDLHSACEH